MIVKFKTILAHLLMPFYLIRSSYLTAYRATRKTGRFNLGKTHVPNMFTTETNAINQAQKKATAQNMTWHVISPAPGKYVAVSKKYLQLYKQFKSLHTLNP